MSFSLAVHSVWNGMHSCEDRAELLDKKRRKGEKRGKMTKVREETGKEGIAPYYLVGKAKVRGTSQAKYAKIAHRSNTWMDYDRHSWLFVSFNMINPSFVALCLVPLLPFRFLHCVIRTTVVNGSAP